MGVPIVATPGGVVDAFAKGADVGSNIGDAIIANKRITPELANLMQSLYGSMNQQQDNAQPSMPASPMPQASMPPGNAPTQPQAPIQGPPSPQQAQDASAGGRGMFTPGFIEHFQQRLAQGEDPVALGKEARLAHDGHLPNHPAIVSNGGSNNANMSMPNFGDLTNRDLPTARAMIGDLASYRARREATNERQHGVDVRAGTAGANRDERAREADDKLDAQKDWHKTTSSMYKAQTDYLKTKSQAVSDKDPKVAEAGKNMRTWAQNVTSGYKTLTDKYTKLKAMPPGSVDDDELNSLQDEIREKKQEADDANEILGQAAGVRPRVQPRKTMNMPTQRIRGNKAPPRANLTSQDEVGNTMPVNRETDDEAPTQAPKSNGRIHVTDGKDHYWIDAKHEAAAKRDGFRRAE